jgi:phenylalanyl-tRNA synthetase beta chain
MSAPFGPCGHPTAQRHVLEKTVIRGETSEGMLCSEIELELGPDGSGLMVLDGGFQPGVSLNAALQLSDHTFEIGLTPNRPDCLSMMGVAREIAAIQGVS